MARYSPVGPAPNSEHPEVWYKDARSFEATLHTDTVHELDNSLKGGRIVIPVFEDHLQAFKQAPMLTGGNHASGSGFKGKIKMIWNDRSLEYHQESV